MKCFANKETAERAMAFNLCPYGLVNYYKAKYWFAPETRSEELKARMGSHYSKGKKIFVLDCQTKNYLIQFDCDRVIKKVGVSPYGGVFMD